jgi:hypothetical protein
MQHQVIILLLPRLSSVSFLPHSPILPQPATQQPGQP